MSQKIHATLVLGITLANAGRLVLRDGDNLHCLMNFNCSCALMTAVISKHCKLVRLSLLLCDFYSAAILLAMQSAVIVWQFRPSVRHTLVPYPDE